MSTGGNSAEGILSDSLHQRNDQSIHNVSAFIILLIQSAETEPPLGAAILGKLQNEVRYRFGSRRVEARSRPCASFYHQAG